MPALRSCAICARSGSNTLPNKNIALLAGQPLLKTQADAQEVASAWESKNSPYFTLFEPRGDGNFGISNTLAAPFLRRQDSPACFDLNGSIYVWRRETIDFCKGVALDRSLIYSMPEHHSVDIDPALDCRTAEAIAARFDWSTGELRPAPRP